MQYYFYIGLFFNRLGGAPAGYFIETTDECRFIHTLHWWSERYLSARVVLPL